MKKLFNKNKEIIQYLIFGILTTVVSWGSYALFTKVLGISTAGINIPNVLSWILSVTFAYITNKLWVFESKSWALKICLPELTKFLAARLASGVLEIVGVPLLSFMGLNQSVFGVPDMWAKITTSVLVVIANYFFSKFIIFKKSMNK